jgi:hypothetical protein
MESFRTRVEGAFRFLVERGFVSSETNVGVRFDSPAGVFVLVFYDERENYHGLRVGLTAQPRDALTYTEMLITAGASGAHALFPGKPEPSDFVQELADGLQRYGQRVLSADPMVFDEAKALRRKHTERYMAPPGE